jgi:hypothetical protein
MPPEEEKIPLEQAPFFSPEMPSNHQSNENCKSEKTNSIQKPLDSEVMISMKIVFILFQWDRKITSVSITCRNNLMVTPNMTQNKRKKKV